MRRAYFQIGTKSAPSLFSSVLTGLLVLSNDYKIADYTHIYTLIHTNIRRCYTYKNHVLRIIKT